MFTLVGLLFSNQIASALTNASELLASAYSLCVAKRKLNQKIGQL